jgi:uncharacterized protein (TIGR03435 family)
MKLPLCVLLLASQALQFEVATIKPAPPRDPAANFTVSATLCHGIDNKMPDLPAGVPGLGRCMVTNFSLRGIIFAAYASPTTTLPLRQRVIGGPDWIDNEPYNIEGKAADPSTATEAQLKSMLQQLLADRFKLGFHTETKEVQGFALLLAKDGPKLKPGTGEISGGFRFSGGTMSATNATMDTLARTLTSRLGGPVMDQTGLAGGYVITLPGNIGNDPNGSSPSTALHDELGLRLESQKVKVEIIVINHVERPFP